MFTALPAHGGFLDQITFSTIAIPEPSMAALAALAGLALLNKSLMPNRRCPTPLRGNGNFYVPFTVHLCSQRRSHIL
jgi:hypothetical protein